MAGAETFLGIFTGTKLGGVAGVNTETSLAGLTERTLPLGGLAELSTATILGGLAIWIFSEDGSVMAAGRFSEESS